MVGAPELSFISQTKALQKSAGKTAPVESVRKIEAPPAPNKRCRCHGSCLRPKGPLASCGSLLAKWAARLQRPFPTSRAAVRPSIALPIPEGINGYNFWSKLEHTGEGGCWNWTGAKTPEGYGRVKLDGRLYSAHRIAYALANGGIPAGSGYHGAVIMHACDNPSCCNPAHLSCGTSRDNARDMAAKGRNYIPTGTRRPEGHAKGNAVSRLSLEAAR